MNISTFIPATSPCARAKLTNGLRQCNASGCSNSRSGLHAFCMEHVSRHRRYGDPHGGPLDPRTWAPYRAQVRQLFAANADHPGLLQALRWLDDLMAQAAASQRGEARTFKGAEEFDRLARDGVQSLDVLVEVCALHHVLQTSRACKTDRARDVAMSRAVFMLAPRPRRVYGISSASGKPQSASIKARSSALLHVGQRLRRSLADFLVNVAGSIEAMPDKKAQALASMRAPFRPPTTQFIKEAAATTP